MAKLKPCEFKVMFESERKYSVAEIQNIIQELIRDTTTALNSTDSINPKVWYQGELNGFYICRDLLDHIESEIEEDGR